MFKEKFGKGVTKILYAFYCVNDGKEVEVGSHQVITHDMYYVL